MELHKAKGRLRYGRKSLVVDTDQGIVDFYRSLIPKYHYIQSQMYPAHISVVRNETPPRMDLWRKHDGRTVEFVYHSWIYNGEVYWWLNVFSLELEEIRIELGLSVVEHYIQPPAGFRKTFHITLGNMKNKLRV